MLLLNLYKAWFKMGLFTFGGGYAMLPMIQKEVIEKYQWASEDEVMDYYAIGQCTPGIVAVNTATFIGYKVAKVPGAIVSTLGVISPSLIIISLIASVLTNFSEIETVQHILSGIKIAVTFLMIVSISKIAKNNINNLFGFVVAIMAFFVAFLTDISMVILVIICGILGYLTLFVEKDGDI